MGNILVIAELIGFLIGLAVAAAICGSGLPAFMNKILGTLLFVIGAIVLAVLIAQSWKG